MQAVRDERGKYAVKTSTLALVMAALALVVSITGTAWAVVVSGANVRNESLTGKDIRNGSIRAADLASSVRNALTDTSPWETIPSGRTISGEVYLDSHTSAASDFGVPVRFGALAPVPLILDEQVNFSSDGIAQSTDDDATCTGNATYPSAPAGKVCIYLVNYTIDAANFRGAPLVYQQQTGFRVVWDEGGAGDVVIRAVWAYRAP